MTDTLHTGELATCDFCRAVVPVQRKYLYRENKEREIGDGFTITRYCRECGLEGKPDTNHTDSVGAIAEAIARDICKGTIRINNQESGVAFYERVKSTVLANLPSLQAHTSQQVEEAVLQADATGAYHSGYLAGKAEVEEAVRKETERCVFALARWMLEQPDLRVNADINIGQARDILTPNHQD